MNKASRILFPPHLQFYNSFYTDCIRADQLMIIGYSFSDVHINQTIKSALKANNKLKVLIVDYLKENAKYEKFWEKAELIPFGFPKNIA